MGAGKPEAPGDLTVNTKVRLNRTLVVDYL